MPKALAAVLSLLIAFSPLHVLAAIKPSNLKIHSAPVLKVPSPKALKARLNRPRINKPVSHKDFIGGDCGPKVLQRLLASLKRKVSLKTLIRQTDTLRGETSLYGLKKGAWAQAYGALGVKTDMAGLEKALRAGYFFIAHVGGNKHYAWIQSVDDKWVRGFNPAVQGGDWKISRPIFEAMWRREGLLLSGQGGRKFTLNDLPSEIKSAMTVLSETRQKTIKGGSSCVNTSGSGGGSSSSVGSGHSTTEPVELSNGNLFQEIEDFNISSMGPALSLVRTYNSQIFSDVEGWQPEAGSGGWAVENGVYAGAGDRSLTTDSWQDVDVSLTMQTITPGLDTSFETAWVNFRWQGEDNRYYFLIKTTGELELARYKNGEQTFLVQTSSTSYNPLDAHTVRIRNQGSQIQVWIDGNLQIDHTDTNPLTGPGKVVLESRFCHAHYDNVQITDLATNTMKSWSFSQDDNDGMFGRGWRANVEINLMFTTNGDILARGGKDGRDLYAWNASSGIWQDVGGTYSTLTQAAGGYDLKRKDGTTFHFSSSGRLESIQDRNGNTVTLTYTVIGGRERIDRVTDAAGRTLSFSYDANGHCIQTMDPLGRTVSYSYNALGLLQASTDPRGHSRQFAYDNHGRMTQYTSRRGQRFTYEYAYNNRCVRQTDPEGKVTIFDYLWDVTQVTDAAGKVWTYQFAILDNARSYLLRASDPDGNTTRYERSPERHYLKVTDPNGKFTETWYDDRGNALQTWDAEGNLQQWTYDPVYNQLLTTTNALGQTTRFTYDARGNPVELQDPLGHKMTMTYNAQGLLTSQTDKKGNTTNFFYDASGNLIKRVDAAGNATEYTRDILGRVTQVTDALKNTFQTQYDANGNVLQTTDALGNMTRFSYDFNDNRIRTEDPLGRIVSATYNGYDKAETATDPLLRVNTFTYSGARFMMDGSLDLASVVDAAGSTTTYAYDPRGLKIEETNALGHMTRFQYDPSRNLSQITDANGNPTQYEYDGLNRLTRITYADSSEESSRYDAVGNLVERALRDGSKTTYSYNARNELIGQRTDQALDLNDESWSLDGAWKDFNLKLSLQTLRVGGQEWNTARVRFRQLNDENYYYVLLKTTGVLELTKRKNGVQSILAQVSSPVDPRDSHALQVQAVGGAIKVWVDNQLLLGITDTDPLAEAGQIILQADACLARFDDLGVQDYAQTLVKTWGLAVTYTRDAQNNLVETVNGGTWQYSNIVTDPARWAVGNEATWANFQFSANVQTLAMGEQPWHTSWVKFRHKDPSNYYYFLIHSDGLLELSKFQAGVQSFLTMEPSAYSPTANNRIQVQAQGNHIVVWINGSVALDYTDPDPLTDAGQILLENHFAQSRFADMKVADLSQSLEDFHVNLGMKTLVPGALSHETAWVRFRDQDVNNRYYFLIHKNGLLELTRRKRGIQQVLAAKVSPYHPADLHRVEILAHGPRLQIWVDGTLEIDHLDNDPLIAGPLGLAGFNASSYFHVNGLIPITVQNWDDTLTHTYDANGNRTQTVRNGSQTWTYAYDVLNRLTETTDAADRTVGYQYDALGRRSRVTYPDGGTLDYAYDANSRLNKIRRGTVTLASYTYDAAGRRTSRALANGTESGYEYDAAGQLLSLTNTRAESTLSQYEYSYDALGNRTRKAGPDGTHQYAYDALGQLVQTVEPGTGQRDFTYDGAHNRVQAAAAEGTISYSHNEINQTTATMKGTGVTKLRWDGNGNLAQQVGVSTSTYVHDAYNRLVRVEQTGKIPVSFEYDAAGRRVRKTVGSAVEHYTWDGVQLIEVRDGTGAVIKKFVYGVGIDEPVLMHTVAGDYYYSQDGLGSVSELTSATGSLAEAYRYDAWGNRSIRDAQGHAISVSSVGNPYAFTGREYDNELGIYYYRARYYDPGLGRFLQSDPAGYSDGLNIYGRYCQMLWTGILEAYPIRRQIRRLLPAQCRP
jgi:RHS repeat-associated protein